MHMLPYSQCAVVCLSVQHCRFWDRPVYCCIRWRWCSSSTSSLSHCAGTWHSNCATSTTIGCDDPFRTNQRLWRQIVTHFSPIRSRGGRLCRHPFVQSSLGYPVRPWCSSFRCSGTGMESLRMVFYGADALLVSVPTVSKQWNETTSWQSAFLPMSKRSAQSPKYWDVIGCWLFTYQSIFSSYTNAVQLIIRALTNPAMHLRENFLL